MSKTTFQCHQCQHIFDATVEGPRQRPPCPQGCRSPHERPSPRGDHITTDPYIPPEVPIGEGAPKPEGSPPPKKVAAKKKVTPKKKVAAAPPPEEPPPPEKAPASDPPPEEAPPETEPAEQLF